MDTEEYVALVYKNLKGIATPSEFQQLNQLSARDSQLAQLRVDIENAWDLSGEIPKVVSKDDTTKLINKITHPGKKNINKSSKGKVVTFKRLITSMAAAFVLLFGSYFLFRDSAQLYNEPGEYILADNSTVTLRNGGTLKVLPFDDSQRRVELKGEAYFEIAKDIDKPFVVVSQHAKISVLGTSFLVKENKEETFIDLIEGKISVLDSRTLDTKTLTAGMKVRLDNQGKIVPITTFNNLASWKSGIIEYEDDKLSNVLKEIALIYNSSIELEDQSLEDCVFSAILSDDNIKDILDRIANRFDMDVSQVNTKWILSGGQCK